MKLADLIQKHTWSEVRPVLLREYPDQATSLEVYEHVYQTLQTITSVLGKPELQLVFDDIADNKFGDYIDVSGHTNSDTEDKYAIEFVPWAERLGMGIATETQSKYSELEILAHCLWEMTYVGYSEEAIKNQIDEIMQAKEEFESFRQLYDNSTEV